MSKAGQLAKLIKLIASVFAFGIKLTVPLLGRLLRDLFKGIGKRLRFSITFKAAVTYALIISAVLFVLGVVIVGSFGFFLLHETRSSLAKNSRMVQDMVGDKQVIQEAGIKRYAEIEGIIITVFNDHREVLFTTAKDREQVVFQIPVESFPGISVTGEYASYTITHKPGKDAYYIQIARPSLKEKLYIFAVVLAMAAGFLPAVLLTVILGSRVLRKMLRPIGSMIGTAKAVTARDLDTRLNVVDSHDELKELAETFNEMLDRIQASYEQQNQFVSDASHELRTPIAVIQGYANLLRRWGKEDKEVLEESVNAIKNEADGMKELVEKLLFLARADKNTQKLEKSLFSVNELVDEVLKETKVIDREHTVTGQVGQTITVMADRALIKQALRIFIDNSIKYTPAGGTIRIGCVLERGSAIFTVEDTGIGISAEDLPHVFNRFYKCDKSRTRDGGSTGLGLSIAKWIIEKHQGIITINSAVNTGTKITFTLPA